MSEWKLPDLAEGWSWRITEPVILDRPKVHIELLLNGTVRNSGMIDVDLYGKTSAVTQRAKAILKAALEYQLADAQTIAAVLVQHQYQADHCLGRFYSVCQCGWRTGILNSGKTDIQAHAEHQGIEVIESLGMTKQFGTEIPDEPDAPVPCFAPVDNKADAEYQAEELLGGQVVSRWVTKWTVAS